MRSPAAVECRCQRLAATPRRQHRPGNDAGKRSYGRDPCRRLFPSEIPLWRLLGSWRNRVGGLWRSSSANTGLGAAAALVLLAAATGAGLVATTPAGCDHLALCVRLHLAPHGRQLGVLGLIRAIGKRGG